MLKIAKSWAKMLKNAKNCATLKLLVTGKKVNLPQFGSHVLATLYMCCYGGLDVVIRSRMCLG